MKNANKRLNITETACYLIKNKKADWLNLEDTIRRIKPAATEEDIILGINDAKIQLMTKKKWAKAIKDLKEEFEFWDKVSDYSMKPYLY